MNRRVAVIALFLACVIGASVVAEDPPAEQKRLAVLILTGKGHHDWPTTTPFLKKMFEQSGRFTVEVTENPAECDAAMLAEFDVVFNNDAGRRWGPTMEKALLEFIAGGKGFVVMHGASAGCQGWEVYEDLCGVSARKGSGHGGYYSYKVTVVDPEHPITKGLDSYMSNVEEIYHNLLRKPTAHVLATAFSLKEQRGTGKDEPMLVVTTHGKGRNFHMVMGNTVSSMENAYWQALTLRGTEWAATGNVTLPLPDPKE